jgi:hypothetical protein
MCHAVTNNTHYSISQNCCQCEKRKVTFQWQKYGFLLVTSGIARICMSVSVSHILSVLTHIHTQHHIPSPRTNYKHKT